MDPIDFHRKGEKNIMELNGVHQHTFFKIYFVFSRRKFIQVWNSLSFVGVNYPFI